MYLWVNTAMKGGIDMLGWDTIQTILFAVLSICFIFYLLMGVSSYRRDNRSKTNIVFFYLCLCMSCWAIGYAFMLISPTIEIANIWRILSAIGWCFFNGLWFAFARSLDVGNQKKIIPKIQYLLFTISAIFFAGNLLFEPAQVVSREPYGFVDNLYTATLSGTIFSIYNAGIILTSIYIIYLTLRKSRKNRIRKQLKIILITSFISVSLALLTDIILPNMGMMVYPSGILTISIGMAGMWYAIEKYKMMSISYELVSEYLFDAVKEPIFIIGEDFLVKNCNESFISTTGFSHHDLKGKSLETIINFRDFEFETILQAKNVINLEVDCLRKNKEALVCELTATTIFDEYKDSLGILILLHDVSERKKIAEIQKDYTLRLKEKNLKLRKEIKERRHAEEQIRHFIYYDTLTGLFNRKKAREDLEGLLEIKNEKFAMLFIDLDHFKDANDHYGHEVGDLILKMVADRLKNTIQPIQGTINRIGGDEFVILQRNLKDLSDAEKTAEAVLLTLGTAFTYRGEQLLIGASIGISYYPDHGTDADVLMNKADFAMYEAKREGGNRYKIAAS